MKYEGQAGVQSGIFFQPLDKGLETWPRIGFHSLRGKKPRFCKGACRAAGGYEENIPFRQFLRDGDGGMVVYRFLVVAARKGADSLDFTGRYGVGEIFPKMSINAS